MANGVTVGIRTAKKGFFDSEKVLKEVKYAERRALSKAGAYVRRAARDRLRKRKSSAGPGESPNVHVSGMGLRQIFFFYDWNEGTVIIGPIGYGTQPHSNVTVPELMEKGGTVQIRVTAGLLSRLYRQGQYDSSAMEAHGALVSKKGQIVTLNYDPHPFMKPAREEVEPDMADFWHDSIRP